MLSKKREGQKLAGIGVIQKNGPNQLAMRTGDETMPHYNAKQRRIAIDQLIDPIPPQAPSVWTTPAELHAQLGAVFDPIPPRRQGTLSAQAFAASRSGEMAPRFLGVCDLPQVAS